MRAAIINDGIVENIIAVDSLDVIPGLIDGTGAAIGDTWDGAEYIKPLPPPPARADYIAALESAYDAKAAERSYDNRFTCALRAGYVGPFQAEGQAFAQWMDACNARAYEVMAEVLAGQRPQPTIAELLQIMPTMVWP